MNDKWFYNHLLFIRKNELLKILYNLSYSKLRNIPCLSA